MILWVAGKRKAVNLAVVIGGGEGNQINKTGK